MNTRFLKLVLVVASATALSACSTSIRDNPCLVWLADNGPYIVKFTAKNPADTCHVAADKDGQVDTVAAQIYPQKDVTTIALLPYEVVDVDPNTGLRSDAVSLATGTFDNNGVAVDDACTVPTLTPSENTDTGVKYEYSNLSFIEDAATQGMAFKGDVKVTDGCTSEFSFVALGWAYFTECSTGADCIPIPDPSAGRFVGAPYSPTIQTKCDKSPEVVNTLTGDPDLGVCFFANPYPSLCPEGSLAGDANCPIN